MHTHLIFLADEIGMASVFPEIKDKLAGDPGIMITLLYYLHADNFLFQKELDILEKHFPARLYVCYETIAAGLDAVLNQESIEAVINANTVAAVNFIVSASQSFTENAIHRLRFLGIKNITVQEQFFSY